MNPINKIFFKGLIAVIPLTLTLYLLFWFADTVELWLEHIFKFFFPDNWYTRGLGLVLGLPLVFFFGAFLESLTFQRLFNNLEKLIIQIPIVKSIYKSIRDISSLFSSKSKGQFKQVVLVKAPHDTVQRIGFITLTDFGDVLHPFIPDDQIAVYLPLSYSMGGGTTIIISRENVTEIDMSIEDALRFVATAGVVSSVPDDKKIIEEFDFDPKEVP
ncbi:DUF502 domain-containing protein [Methylotuvimicrobium alcaliphilum]|uniref:DUF502 domain-containing protein n=1 Tax=Methylotuvimicrobium alcaliphilum (strain DSM 19304 / NCIMB 14124 / VKM B-2133 / 20Z) TaxID=1091494 RepID=G4SX82_META2|nr:DUF502 domain-containing protein [Methylotuvimicrobium alcaliphilum]CCE24238.1 conserved protein of unknown function [Methylotuvimicrobium alcaliphilum 20Z]